VQPAKNPQLHQKCRSKLNLGIAIEQYRCARLIYTRTFEES